MNKASQTVGNIVWSSLGSALTQAVTMGVFLLNSRLLTKEDFGLVAVCLLTVELFKRLTIESVTIAANSSPDNDDTVLTACFYTNILVGVLGVFISFALAPILAYFVHSDRILRLMPVCGLLLPFMAISRSFETWFSRRLQFRTLAIRSLVAVILGGLAGISAAYNGLALWSLVIQQFVYPLVSTAILYFTSPWRPGKRSVIDIKRLLNQAFVISQGVVWSFFAAETDVYIAAFYYGAAAAGIYSSAKRLLLAINLALVHPLASVMLPTFAAARGNESRKRVFIKGLSLVVIVTAPSFLGLAFTACDLVSVALGPKWVMAGPLLSIMTLNGFVFSLAQFSTAIFLSLRSSLTETRLNMVQALVTWFALVLFARSSLTGIAYCVAVSSLALLPVRLWIAGRMIGAGPGEIKSVLKPLGLPIMLLFASLWIGINQLTHQAPVWRLIVLVCLGASVYGSALLLISRKALRQLVRPANP